MSEGLVVIPDQYESSHALLHGSLKPCTSPILDSCTCFSQVSGVGSDSVFMGAMHAATAPPNVIRVWCMPTGGVVSGSIWCQSMTAPETWGGS
eukprot:scaffold69156_cov16-Tisochrysis_lutea.AAC.1